MSHKWGYDALNKLSKAALAHTIEQARLWGCTWVMDNVHIPRRVFESRLGMAEKYTAGTAMMAIILPAGEKEFLSCTDLHRQRIDGSKECFDTLRLAIPPPIEKLPHQFFVHHILSTLLHHLSFAKYEHRDSQLLVPPKPINTVPSRKSNVRMLPTVKINEGSHSGMDDVFTEFIKTLEIKSSEERMERLAREDVVGVVGDGLSYMLALGNYKVHAEDANGVERQDFALHSFGILHTLMAVANSLHSQYYGTPTGHGLCRDFQILQRKGLATQKTKGPFFNQLNEAIHHILSAHLLDCWLEASPNDISDIEDLVDYSPLQLVELAEKILKGYTSTEAMVTAGDDEVFRNAVMFNRDALVYVEFVAATKAGDVGRFLHLLPALTARFLGGGNGTYSKIFLEFNQCLEREWSTDTK